MEDLRIRVDIARLKEMIKLGEISVRWVSTDNQIADPMTKQGASAMKLVEVLENG